MKDEVQPPFDSFELARSLRVAHRWFLHRWGEDGVNVAFGSRLFELAIADVAAALHFGPLKRSSITSTDLGALFETSESLNIGDSPETNKKHKAGGTLRSAPHDLGPKLAKFIFCFELEDEWFRFMFAIADEKMHGVKRVGRYLSFSYEPCPESEVPDRFKTMLSGSTNEPRARSLSLLRYPSPEFLGRDDELRRIRRIIRTGAEIPIVAIEGTPGVGKTDLALAAALSLRYRYDEILYLQFGRSAIDRASKDPGRELLEKAVGVLEDGFAPGQSRRAFSASTLRERYLALLQDRNVIVICDDVESGSWVEPLTPPSGSAMLVVSSAAIALRGVTDALHLEPLKLADAVSLLGRHSLGRISGTVPGATFKPAPLAVGVASSLEDYEVSTAIAEFFDRLPLALVTVATYVALRPDLTMTALVGLVVDAQRRLMLSPEKAEMLPPPIAVAYEMRYAWLTKIQRRVFSSVSVFTSSFSADAEAVICEDSDNASLSELVRQHLVSFDIGARRYELLNLTTAFGRSKLSVEKSESLLDKFANYFADYAERVAAAHREVTNDNVGVGIHLFDFESPSLFECLHLISHRMCSHEKWARLGLRFSGLLRHPRMVASSHYETSLRTIAHCAEEAADDAVLAECMLLLGRVLAHQPGWFQIAEYSHDAEDILLACIELARKLGNAGLERAAVEYSIRSSLLRNTHAKTVAYIAEKISLDLRDDAMLELLYDALLAYEIAVMYDDVPPDAPLVDITQLQPHSYVALLLFDTMRQMPSLEATLEYHLLAAANSAGKPKISLSDYAYSLVAEDANAKKPLDATEALVWESSEELLEFPMLALRYPEVLPPDQSVACLSAAIPVAEAIGRNFTAARMLMIRSGLLADRGDIDLACEDLERAVSVTEPKILWIDRSAGKIIRTRAVASAEDVREAVEQRIASLRSRSPKTTATKHEGKAAPTRANTTRGRPSANASPPKKTPKAKPAAKKK